MANGRNYLTGSDAEGVDGVPLKQFWSSYSIVRLLSNQGLDYNGLPGSPGNVGPRQNIAAELMLVLRKCLTQFCHKFCIPGSNLPRKGTQGKNKGQQQMGESVLSNLFFSSVHLNCSFFFTFHIFFFKPSQRQSCARFGVLDLKGQTQYCPGRAYIELNYISLCLQFSLYGGIQHKSICVGKQKHKDIVHDLLDAVFISFKCFTASNAPTFSGKFSGERAQKLRTSCFFTKS